MAIYFVYECEEKFTKTQISKIIAIHFNDHLKFKSELKLFLASIISQVDLKPKSFPFLIHHKSDYNPPFEVEISTFIIKKLTEFSN